MIPHIWTHSVDKKAEFSISFVSIVAISMVRIVRGVMRLDGARGKKQVWCPHCYRQIACKNFITVQKTSLLKSSQPWNSQHKFKRGCSQSKLIIKSADPKGNVIKTSAKSQDESQDTSEITWCPITIRWNPKHRDLPEGSGSI